MTDRQNVCVNRPERTTLCTGPAFLRAPCSTDGCSANWPVIAPTIGVFIRVCAFKHPLFCTKCMAKCNGTRKPKWNFVSRFRSRVFPSSMQLPYHGIKNFIYHLFGINAIFAAQQAMIPTGFCRFSVRILVRRSDTINSGYSASPCETSISVG